MPNIQDIVKHKQHYMVKVTLPTGTSKEFSTEEYNEDIIMDRFAKAFPGVELGVQRTAIEKD